MCVCVCVCVCACALVCACVHVCVCACVCVWIVSLAFKSCNYIGKKSGTEPKIGETPLWCMHHPTYSSGSSRGNPLVPADTLQ